MFRKNWKKEVLTIPNLLSLFRLTLIPVYLSVYRNATQLMDFRTAGAIMALSCMTDLADGKIARRFHMVTTLGKILDPLADKATQLALMLCLSLHYTALKPVFTLLVIKELIQLILALVYLARGQMLPGALMAGKACTVVLFVSLILLVVFPALPAPVVNGIALLDSAFLIISSLSYFQAYWGAEPKVQDLKDS